MSIHNYTYTRTYTGGRIHKMREHIQNAVQKTQVPTAYDLSVTDFKDLYNLVQEGREWEALTTAFNYGFHQGRQAEKNKQKKARKTQ